MSNLITSKFSGEEADQLLSNFRNKMTVKCNELVQTAISGETKAYIEIQYSFPAKPVRKFVEEFLRNLPQQHNIEVSEVAGIQVNWCLEDWLNYPDFFRLSLQARYNMCVENMRNKFARGFRDVDLSVLFQNKMNHPDLLESLAEIFARDGFALTYETSDSLSNPTVVTVTRT